MDRFSGFEPQVGEIRALRTYRIGRDARLYPLFSTQPWSDGTNTALCRSRPSPRSDPDHQVVDPGCTCGFYAYADEPAAAEYPYARHVLAVVACWGRVVAGTRGLRCEHARVEAIWMSPTVPAHLAVAVAGRYPSTVGYADKAAMLAAHPPTLVDCYQTPSPRERTRTRIGLVAALLSALVLGLLPWRWLAGNHDALGLWAVALCAFTLAALGYGKRAEVAARKRALICSAAVLWLIAPLAGPAGFYCLRLPVLQLVTLARWHRRAAIRASSHFPADIG